GSLPDSEVRRLTDSLASGRAEALIVCGAASQTTRVDVPAKRDGAAAPPPREWAFDGLHLITVCGEEHVLVVFGGAVTSWGGTVLVVGLPAEAEVRAACIGGHWLQSSRCVAAGDATRTLPLPKPGGRC